MTSNTFSDLMYYLADTDHLLAAVFFAAGIVILSLWLMNLLIAVITTSFQVIREESKRSAFASDKVEDLPVDNMTPTRQTPLQRLYKKTNGFWIIVITLGLVVQCLRSASMSVTRATFVDNTETVITLVLLFEIILRFASDWRHFFHSKRNIVDLGLAVITAVIQIPPIHESGQPYSWLTIFQIARIYRVVLAFRITRDLIMVVFGNIYGILNLILFVFLITFLAAILATQLFRGEIPYADAAGDTIQVTFYNIFNSFIGMYQVLSSENWTSIMYNVTQFDVRWDTAWLGAIFFIMWFILANFIVLNMFIAVIQESFDVSEDEKRLQQVKAFLHQKELGGSTNGNMSLSSIFKLGRSSFRRRDPLDYGPATMEMLLKDAVVKEFLDEDELTLNRPRSEIALPDEPLTTVETGTLSALWSKITGKALKREPNPFYSKLKFSRAYDDLDPRTMAKEVVSATEQRRRAQRLYLQRHPHYNVSLFIFGPKNPIRKACQSLVGPGRGTHRIEGVEPYKPLWYTFSFFIYAAIVCMVLLACITTPLYQKGWYVTRPDDRAWFVWTDMGFAILFSLEAVIKIIADGFFWTPNAYFRSSWGFIDGIVLITLWINVITSFFRDDSIARAVGAFKALRALRLLNVSDNARDTFHSVIIVGGWKVISAAFVSISLLFPFAIYGLNLFSGKMESCNDGDFAYTDLTNCVSEYGSSPYNWTVLAPRQVANSYYSFDNFASSLFILFQIVSQEGWIDVMWSAMSITGQGLQPRDFAATGNAVYFIVFNLLGAVFVLTLFVSVFMRNYTEQTGVAFLTSDQRSWLELRKLLRQISPSKRSVHEASKSWQVWCYKIVSKKHGTWQRFITTVLLLHMSLLIVEFYPDIPWWDTTRKLIFLGFTFIYIWNIIMRIIGLSWTRFRHSSWDLYSLVVVVSAFITTFLSLGKPDNNILNQLHKLFLVAIALLLIPRNNQLDQLFKTAAASFSTIGNLLATWFVLFLVFAIAFTQTFGLTRFGENETGNLNFRNVPKALILLFRMSSGEGWNQIMNDFSVIEPPYCVEAASFFSSDCGSTAWARVLFISWNILSMYLFVSLFVSLIFESFSYVYQQSGSSSVISRDEIRRFKQAWAMFDPDGTGYISKEVFPRLLGELSGIFQMRIYDGDFTVHRILEDCKASDRDALSASRAFDGVDLDKLRERINSIPVSEIRSRRERMNIFYEEMLVSADPDRGILFTTCLMILSHYNLISDSKSLRLEEFLRRRARLQRVEEAVRRNIVVGFFDTMYWSRQFRRRIEARRDSRMGSVPSFSVPEIYVDDPEELMEHRATKLQGQFTDSLRDFAKRKSVLESIPFSSSTI
ncbi:putative calcium channel subunit cch1 [Phaeomoniella chlamydospora]|uniref:Calcium-channel protein CCH1 n=1 Tax=Phaeomoniella chlamydospora TaxID=158046 RepID=A0A0G2HF72_PHACM|nr:putative calcium channel subunit cch1 [Phaeomoniella chlamydospora]